MLKIEIEVPRILWSELRGHLVSHSPRDTILPSSVASNHSLRSSWYGSSEGARINQIEPQKSSNAWKVGRLSIYVLEGGGEACEAHGDMVQVNCIGLAHFHAWCGLFQFLGVDHYPVPPFKCPRHPRGYTSLRKTYPCSSVERKDIALSLPCGARWIGELRNPSRRSRRDWASRFPGRLYRQSDNSRQLSEVTWYVPIYKWAKFGAQCLRVAYRFPCRCHPTVGAHYSPLRWLQYKSDIHSTGTTLELSPLGSSMVFLPVAGDVLTNTGLARE